MKRRGSFITRGVDLGATPDPRVKSNHSKHIFYLLCPQIASSRANTNASNVRAKTCLSKPLRKQQLTRDGQAVMAQELAEYGTCAFDSEHF